jgi:hypothetical protein
MSAGRRGKFDKKNQTKIGRSAGCQNSDRPELIFGCTGSNQYRRNCLFYKGKATKRMAFFEVAVQANIPQSLIKHKPMLYLDRFYNFLIAKHVKVKF